jgi:hypothetical protein
MTTTTKPHADGGTYRVLQLAETMNQWAIALTEWTTYRGTVKFEVLRVSPANATVRLGLLDTEAEARSFANHEWKLDRKV